MPEIEDEMLDIVDISPIANCELDIHFFTSLNNDDLEILKLLGYKTAGDLFDNSIYDSFHNSVNNFENEIKTGLPVFTKCDGGTNVLNREFIKRVERIIDIATSEIAMHVERNG